MSLDWMDKKLDDYEEKVKQKRDVDSQKRQKELEITQNLIAKNNEKMELIKKIFLQAKAKLIERSFQVELDDGSTTIQPGGPAILQTALKITNKFTKLKSTLQFTSAQEFSAITTKHTIGKVRDDLVGDRSDRFDVDNITESTVNAQLKLFIEAALSD
jgi:hypothetical protein